MLRLWGRTSSINVRKVVWAAQELSLELQRTDAGGQFGLVREAQFLSLNPNGLVPLIENEGTTLWESNTIVRYLCARHAPGDLYPEDLPTRFLAEQWMDWQQTTLNPAGRDAFLQWVRT
ncbi:glutathione S-transferase, partial [Corallococcus coralloides]|nr:glutathione S-transferase [Corallococcus coralloides]